MTSDESPSQGPLGTAGGLLGGMIGAGALLTAVGLALAAETMTSVGLLIGLGGVLGLLVVLAETAS